MSLINIKNLSFSYLADKVKVPIFKDFNLKVNKGDFIAIKGPSGSGKSTLLYLIAGLLKKQSGEISVKNQDISSLNDTELSFLRNKKMGFIFQQFHLLPKSSVLDNILLPTFYPIEESQDKKKGKARALKLGKDLGISERMNHLPNQLSGGQQQRVAIARALMNDAEIILADEPTGNLDSKSTKAIIEILLKLNSEGKTIILITHENEVASQASKVFHLKDGMIEKEEIKKDRKNFQFLSEHSFNPPNINNSISKNFKILSLALTNAFKNKTRSFLTMLGIIVGVAAVCSMITLGNFTKNKILASYAELGVNTVVFRGIPNWNLKAIDQYPVKYNFFNWDRELVPLKKIFSNVKLISPSMRAWYRDVSSGGKVFDQEVIGVGVSEDGIEIMGRKLALGKGISRYHVERKDPVCVIGYEIGKRFFSNTSPIGQMINLPHDEHTYICKVIGVLESKTSNNEWIDPNRQILLPFTYHQAISESWRSQIYEVLIQLHEGTNIEKFGNALRIFFEKKYGKSGLFRVDSDSILIAQMNKFLTLFSILLGAIALVCLAVGGMGITNMMLVSVSERLKEIGIRKSIGATHSSIRYQFLYESILLCFFAGIVGIIFGIVIYQGAIYGAAQLIKKFQYEWVVDPFAMIFSFVSILGVGILSGLIPAIKAEKLQVIDALRSE